MPEDGYIMIEGFECVGSIKITGSNSYENLENDIDT